MAIPRGRRTIGRISGIAAAIILAGWSYSGRRPTRRPDRRGHGAEKRALVERGFFDYGAPRRFTFKASSDGTA